MAYTTETFKREHPELFGLAPDVGLDAVEAYRIRLKAEQAAVMREVSKLAQSYRAKIRWGIDEKAASAAARTVDDLPPRVFNRMLEQARERDLPTTPFGLGQEHEHLQHPDHECNQNIDAHDGTCLVCGAQVVDPSELPPPLVREDEEGDE